ncbi:MAG: sigma factor [Acetobacter syzygii]|uniref:sigma factor n=1 Tax=Acetobacter syzygii TaxID=146476 RepID=UPI00243324FC|nr:sigma factor [Acetobacter syzygii]
MVGRDTGYLDIFVAHRQKLTDYANGIVKDAARAEDLVQEAFLRFNTADVVDEFQDKTIR